MTFRYNSPDIGICDDCGTDTGSRRLVERDVIVDGRPARVALWLCPVCARDAR